MTGSATFALHIAMDKHTGYRWALLHPQKGWVRYGSIPVKHLGLPNYRRVTQALATLPLSRLIVAHRPETIAGAQRVVGLNAGNALEVKVSGALRAPASTCA